MKELKNGFKLFYIKDGDLHQVLLTEDQEHIFQNLSLALIAGSGNIKVDIEPICKLGIKK